MSQKAAKKKIPPPPPPPRSRTLLIGIIAIGVVVLILAAGVAVQYWRTHSDVSAKDPGGSEPAMITGPGTDGKGITVGKADARSTIEVYVDFRCPHCKEFEDKVGPTLNELVDSGAAKLTYFPLAFVSKDDSPRIANAFACAAAAGKARGYHDSLFHDFVKGWTSDQLLDLGKDVGTSDSFNQCAKDNKYSGWLDSIGKAANTRGVTATPTVFVNDTKLADKDLTPEGIRSAAGVSG